MIDDETLALIGRTLADPTLSPRPWRWDAHAWHLRSPDAQTPIVTTDAGYYGPYDADSLLIGRSREWIEDLYREVLQLRAIVEHP